MISLYSEDESKLITGIKYDPTNPTFFIALCKNYAAFHSIRHYISIDEGNLEFQCSPYNRMNNKFTLKFDRDILGALQYLEQSNIIDHSLTQPIRDAFTIHCVTKTCGAKFVTEQIAKITELTAIQFNTTSRSPSGGMFA